jgi:SAM-dependent methyltransferase
MIIYAVTVVLGACLLFLVQPLLAKIILPWFGGTSAVWSAALVFFQVCVLGGYCYAHWLATHIHPRRQGVIHGALLIIGCALMPIMPSEAWRPTDAGDPMLQILMLLAANVGLPALLLCSTSPLLHVWYMRRTGADVPYWLFAVSNFGSMLALLSFPFLLEPAFDSRTLAIGWSALFVVYAALCICAAWMSRKGAPLHESPAAGQAGRAPGLRQMGLWVLLSACAAAMLVAVSAHLSTNVAPIPLLWVAPLALYLLTFILNFSSSRFYGRTSFFPLLAVALGCIAYLYVNADGNLHIQYVIPLYLAGLFLCCMACHGELAYGRPTAQFLTRFYLLIALGGALGGVFVAVIAPTVFDTYLELPLLLIVMAVLNAALQWRRRGSSRTLWPVRLAMIGGVVALTGYLARTELASRNEHLLVRRNFYGVLRVRDDLVGTELASRHLIHGTISHGSQFLSDAYRGVAGSYFSTSSGVGRALQALQAQGSVRYGVIGLGAGVLASYAREGDYLRIYEINPDVFRIADEFFTFLARARAAGADARVLLGDGRLVLDREERQNFDLLVVDAFSSDAVPTHLLTNEAVQLYFEHLKPGGVLAIQISNRYLDLAPVCLRAAEHVNRSATVVRSSSDGMVSASVWVLITANNDLLHQPQFDGAHLRPAKADSTFPGWSDQYSSVLPLLTLDVAPGTGATN